MARGAHRAEWDDPSGMYRLIVDSRSTLTPSASAPSTQSKMPPVSKEWNGREGHIEQSGTSPSGMYRLTVDSRSTLTPSVSAPGTQSTNAPSTQREPYTYLFEDQMSLGVDRVSNSPWYPKRDLYTYLVLYRTSLGVDGVSNVKQGSSFLPPSTLLICPRHLPTAETYASCSHVCLQDAHLTCCQILKTGSSDVARYTWRSLHWE